MSTKWTSVEDELPSNGRSVLCWGYSDIDPGPFAEVSGHDPHFGWSGVIEPTHWRELPAGPARAVDRHRAAVESAVNRSVVAPLAVGFGGAPPVWTGARIECDLVVDTDVIADIQRAIADTYRGSVQHGPLFVTREGNEAFGLGAVEIGLEKFFGVEDAARTPATVEGSLAPLLDAARLALDMLRAHDGRDGQAMEVLERALEPFE